MTDTNGTGSDTVTITVGNADVNNDGDGWTVAGGDCDDNDPQVNPGKNEKGPRRKDGKDNDCNGIIDG